MRRRAVPYSESSHQRASQQIGKVIFEVFGWSDKFDITCVSEAARSYVKVQQYMPATSPAPHQRGINRFKTYEKLKDHVASSPCLLLLTVFRQNRYKYTRPSAKIRRDFKIRKFKATKKLGCHPAPRFWHLCVTCEAKRLTEKHGHRAVAAASDNKFIGVLSDPRAKPLTGQA